MAQQQSVCSHQARWCWPAQASGCSPELAGRGLARESASLRHFRWPVVWASGEPVLLAAAANTRCNRSLADWSKIGFYIMPPHCWLTGRQAGRLLAGGGRPAAREVNATKRLVSRLVQPAPGPARALTREPGSRAITLLASGWSPPPPPRSQLRGYGARKSIAMPNAASGRRPPRKVRLSTGCGPAILVARQPGSRRSKLRPSRPALAWSRRRRLSRLSSRDLGF